MDFIRTLFLTDDAGELLRMLKLATPPLYACFIRLGWAREKLGRSRHAIISCSGYFIAATLLLGGYQLLDAPIIVRADAAGFIGRAASLK